MVDLIEEGFDVAVRRRGASGFEALFARQLAPLPHGRLRLAELFREARQAGGRPPTSQPTIASRWLGTGLSYYRAMASDGGRRHCGEPVA